MGSCRRAVHCRHHSIRQGPAVALVQGDIVAISAASGGIGTIAVQLARRAGATVLGIAGPTSDDWVARLGAIPVNYGDGLADRLRAVTPRGRVDAFLDFFGQGYVRMAVTELGVSPERVNTGIDRVTLVTYPIKATGEHVRGQRGRPVRVRGPRFPGRTGDPNSALLPP